MKKNYNSYSAEKLAQDPAFIRWVLEGKGGPSWESWLSKNPEKQALIEEAKQLVLPLSFSQKRMSVQQKAELWSRIDEATAEHSAPVVSMKRTNWRRMAIGMAAAILALIAFWFVANPGLEEIRTPIAKTIAHTLPDQSTININANSQIAFNQKQWEKDRTLTLEGQAYFEVTHDKVDQSKFKVKTALGEVTVLGTRFDVYARNEVFRVRCYEGKVAVTSNGKSVILEKGMAAQLDESKGLDTIPGSAHNQNQTPSWMSGIQDLGTTTCQVVFEEMENHYQGLDILFDEGVGAHVIKGYFNKHKDIEEELDNLLSTSLKLGWEKTAENTYRVFLK